METLFYYVGAAVCGFGGILLTLAFITGLINQFRMNANDTYFYHRYMMDRADFKRYMIAIKHKEATK